MGRFFKATAPDFVDDNMFKLPWQMMAGVIGAKDKAIESAISEPQALDENLKAQGLAVDDPYIQQTIAAKRQEIDDIVNGIKSNPMDYTKFSGKTRGLSRSISDEWTNGGIAKIEANRKAYTDYTTKLDDAFKKDPTQYSAEQIAGLKEQALNKYTVGKGAAYNKDTGAFNTFSGDDALGLGNVTDTLNQNVGKYIKADAGETVYMSNSGEWRVKTKTGDKGVGKEKLRDASKAYIKANPDMVSAIGQRTQLGLKGFEDPVQYLENSIDAFVKANTYNEHSKDVSEQASGEYARQSTWDHEKKQQQEDMFTYFTEGKLTGIGGSTVEEYNTNLEAAEKGISNSKSRAMDLVIGASNGEYTSLLDLQKKNPTIYNRINRGDFTDIKKMQTGSDIVNQYKQSKLNLAGIQALTENYRKKVKAGEKGIGSFNEFLHNAGTIKTDDALSWKDVDPNMTFKNLKALNEQVATDEVLKTSIFQLPKGEVMMINGKSFDLGAKAYTINEFINAGAIRAERIKVPKIGVESAAMKDGNGNITTPEQYEIQYSLTDGSGVIGFDMSKGVIPVTSLDDEGKIGLSTVMNFRGKQFQARVNNASTQSMIDYSKVNSKLLRAKQYFERNSRSGDIKLPNTKGAIYHSEDVKDSKGQIISKKGEITVPKKGGGFIKIDTKNPATMKEVANWLF